MRASSKAQPGPSQEARCTRKEFILETAMQITTEDADYAENAEEEEVGRRVLAGTPLTQ